MYKGPMDKDNGGGDHRVEGGEVGWLGRGRVVGGKWRQLYLNNNKKKRNEIREVAMCEMVVPFGSW